MDNIANIKNVYLYNKTLHNKVIKKERKKRIIWAIASLWIILISTFSFIYIVTNGNLAKQWVVLWIFLMVLAIFSFFCLMYNLFTLGSFLTEKILFSDRTYATTNNDEIITFKFERNSSYFRYDLLKGNLLDELVKVLVLQMSVSKENKEINQKIQDKNVLLNDLYECLNIVNVYKVVEKKDRIEIMCDYIDLINNTACKNKSLTIYKCYDNFEELLNKLKKKEQKKKKSITQENGEHDGFVKFVLGGSGWSNTFSFHAAMILVLLSLLKNEVLSIGFVLEFGMAFLICILYCQKRALKYLHKDSEEDRNFLLKRIKINVITLVLYSIFLIIYSIIYTEAIQVTLFGAICVLVVILLLILKIEK